MNKDLTIEDFYNVFWGDYVSKYIVTTEMIINNQEFIDEITYDMYRIYMNTEINISVLARMAESFFKNFRIYSPNVKI